MAELDTEKQNSSKPFQAKPVFAKPKGLMQSTAVVGSMTMLSRVLGLLRDIVYARFFGAGLVMDAFFVAFKIPNIFRRFFVFANDLRRQTNSINSARQDNSLLRVYFYSQV